VIFDGVPRGMETPASPQFTNQLTCITSLRFSGIYLETASPRSAHCATVSQMRYRKSCAACEETDFLKRRIVDIVLEAFRSLPYIFKVFFSRRVSVGVSTEGGKQSKERILNEPHFDFRQ